jgi:uncharacterized protein affecting Mg2+/Co2+ transport
MNEIERLLAAARAVRLRAHAPYSGFAVGAVLETPVGSMHGSYQMVADDGAEFDAPIPAFRLAIPGVLH